MRHFEGEFTNLHKPIGQRQKDMYGSRYAGDIYYAELVAPLQKYKRRPTNADL